MFQQIVNEDGTSTLRCAVTDREHVFTTGDFGAKKAALEVAEQMQRAILHKLGFDVKKTPRPMETYREAYAVYQRKRGK